MVDVPPAKARFPPSKVRCFVTHLRFRLLHHTVPVRVGVGIGYRPLSRAPSVEGSGDTHRLSENRYRIPTALHGCSIYDGERDGPSACCIETIERVDQRQHVVAGRIQCLQGNRRETFIDSIDGIMLEGLVHLGPADSIPRAASMRVSKDRGIDLQIVDGGKSGQPSEVGIPFNINRRNRRWPVGNR